MTTKQGRIAFGLKTTSSSRFEQIPAYPATESYDATDTCSSSDGASSTTRFTLPAITRHTSIALRVASPHTTESWALPLLAVVLTPFAFPWSPLPPPQLPPWKPCLMMVQTPQLPCTEAQREEEPRAPSAHVKVVQWNRKSSLPSAAHLGFFLVLPSARFFTVSLHSSNRWMVRWVLCTFSIRSILHIGLSFFNQLDLKIISTMFRPESSGPSSETVSQTQN